MIRPQLSRPEWERVMRGFGAEPLSGLTARNTAEWWRVPGRPPFVVPVLPDGGCDFWAIQRIRQRQGGAGPFGPLED